MAGRLTGKAALRWRPLADADLPGVMAVAAAMHADYPEAEGVFAERLRLFPRGCRALVDAGDRLHGYVVSHPWRAREPVPLDTLLGGLPTPPTTLYLHDLALLPSARGTGAAGAVVRALVDLAHGLGLPTLSLVAVGDSAGFWVRQGFAGADGAPRGYGAGAAFMVRASAPAQSFSRAA